MEDHNGISNPDQKLLTPEESKLKELRDRLTPDFLKTLHDFATHVGWSLDLIEISKFVELAYKESKCGAVFKEIEG